jgi:hypothetical protein
MGWEASFRGQLPDETLVQLVQAGVDVSFGGSAVTDFFSKNGFALVMLLPMLMIAFSMPGRLPAASRSAARPSCSTGPSPSIASPTSPARTKPRSR